MSLVHHLDTIAQNRYIYLGACNVMYAMLSMKSSDGKKVDVTFELTCVHVIPFFSFSPFNCCVPFISPIILILSFCFLGYDVWL